VSVDQVSIEDVLDLDAVLSDYIDMLYYSEESEPQSFSKASFALNGLAYVDPKLRGKLQDAWRSLVSWQKLTPPGEGKPIPVEALAYIANHLRRKGEEEAALMVEVATDGWLRSQDLSLLRYEDVAVSTCPTTGERLISLSLGSVERGERTKTGPRQGVLMDFPGLGDRLMKHRSSMKKQDKLFKTSSAKLGKLWRKAMEELGLDLGPFHSIRHSGPSRDHLLGYRDLTAIMKRGRWRVAASVNRYSKSHTYVTQLSRVDESIIQEGLRLMSAWGVRSETAR